MSDHQPTGPELLSELAQITMKLATILERIEIRLDQHPTTHTHVTDGVTVCEPDRPNQAAGGYE